MAGKKNVSFEIILKKNCPQNTLNTLNRKDDYFVVAF